MRYQYKHRERPQRPASQYYSSINKHYFLEEDRQQIRFVCSAEALIIQLLINVGVCGL